MQLRDSTSGLPMASSLGQPVEIFLGAHRLLARHETCRFSIQSCGPKWASKMSLSTAVDVTAASKLTSVSGGGQLHRRTLGKL